MLDMWWELLLPDEKEQIVGCIKRDLLSKHVAECSVCRADDPCGIILPIAMLVTAMETT